MRVSPPGCGSHRSAYAANESPHRTSFSRDEVRVDYPLTIHESAGHREYFSRRASRDFPISKQLILRPLGEFDSAVREVVNHSSESGHLATARLPAPNRRHKLIEPRLRFIANLRVFGFLRSPGVKLLLSLINTRFERRILLDEIVLLFAARVVQRVVSRHQRDSSGQHCKRHNECKHKPMSLR